MWEVSWLYEKVHNIANFGGYAAILICGREGLISVCQHIRSAWEWILNLPSCTVNELSNEYDIITFHLSYKISSSTPSMSTSIHCAATNHKWLAWFLVYSRSVLASYTVVRWNHSPCPHQVLYCIAKNSSLCN